MPDIPHIGDPLFAPLDHHLDKVLDLHPVIHVQPVGFQLGLEGGHRGVHKQQRDPLAAEHLGVVVVEHLKADDSRRPLLIKGSWKAAGRELRRGNSMDGQAVVQVMDLGLEPVQHHGREMRVAEKAGGQHCNLPLAVRVGRLFGFLLEQGQIGKLLVPHLSRFAQNFFPGGVCQSAGVVDRFGHRIARQLQLVGNILYGDLASHGFLLCVLSIIRKVFLIVSIMQTLGLVKCKIAKYAFAQMHTFLFVHPDSFTENSLDA